MRQLRGKRIHIHRLLSLFLSLCMFVSLFMGIELKANASVWTGGSMGSGTSGSKYITATGSYYADRYTFTPEYTGVWRFYSTNKSQGDPYIIIADAYNYSSVQSAINSAHCKSLGHGEFASNDDSNGNLNFNVYVFLEKGKTYYIFNTRYSDSSAVYYSNYSYMGAGQITLNKQGGSGGTNYLYGGKSGYSPSKSAYDNWFALNTNANPANTSYITPPTRKGYAFEGYYTGTNGTGTQIISSNGYFNHTTLSNTFSSNGTLYAKWRVLQNTYTLDKNGGSGGQSSVVVNQYATLPTLSSLPTKTGYAFTGYWTEKLEPNQVHAENNLRYKPDGTSTFVNELYNTPVTLYAGWNAKTYNAVLNANGGTGGSSVTMTYDAALPTSGLSKPIKAGYEFNGYYYHYGQDDAVMYYDSDMHVTEVNGQPRTWTHATDGIQLVADWTPIHYNIQLFSNDDVNAVGAQGKKTSGYVTTMEDVAYGDLILPSAEELGMTREHYDFVGWNIYDEQDWAMFKPYTEYHTGLASSEGEDVQLYAAWAIKDNYTISYNINGGTKNYPRSQTIFKGETLTVTDTVPEYTNYSFLGWYTTPNGEGEGPYKAGDLINGIEENTTLYARWVEDKTISYNANGGSFTTTLPTEHYPNTDTAVKLYLPGTEGAKGFEDTTLTADDMPVRTGYRFLGWADSPSAETPDYQVDGTTTFSMENITSNMILYAVWEIEKYDITYQKEIEDESLITIQNEEHTADAPALVQYGDPYAFTVILDDRETDDSGLMVTVNDVVLVNPSPVTDEQQSHIKYYTYRVGAAISAQSVVISGLTKKEYSVTYVTNGGAFADSANVVRSYYFDKTETEKVLLSGDIERVGYQFAGWYKSSSFPDEENPVTEFKKSDAADKTYYAKWTPNKYTITYNKTYSFSTINNESALASQTDCAYDTNITLANPTFNVEGSDIDCKIGRYHFDLLGWSTDEHATAAEFNLGETVRNLSEANNAVVTLYAVWDVPSFKVSFDLNGGESAPVETQVVIEGNSVTFPQAPSRTGYTFAGWKEEGHTAEGDPFITAISEIEKDYQLVAQWKANTYEITYRVVVPTDGKLMTNDTNPVQVADGTYEVNGTTYVVNESPIGTFTIKTDSGIAYDQGYNISQMPFVMHSISGDAYDNFVEQEVVFKSYLDAMAAFCAWQAYDEIAAQWQEASQESVSEGGMIAAGWKEGGYDVADAAWESKLAGVVDNLQDDSFKTYFTEKYEGLLARPAADATDAPDEPNIQRPDAAPDTVAEPTVVTEPTQKAPTEFLGWSTEETATDAMYVAGVESRNLCTGAEGDKTVTLYAVYSTNPVNYLFYDANGGIWPDGALIPQKADSGTDATISTAKTPTKVGYIFEGWSLDGTGTPLTSVSLAGGHQTVKAIWTADRYKVYFDRNDPGARVVEQQRYDDAGNPLEGQFDYNYYPGKVGVLEDEMAAQEMTYGISTNLSVTNYKSTNNYEFLGWSLHSDAVRPEYTDGQSVKNLPYTYSETEREYSVRLYAVWQKKDAFIRFNANGGSGEPNSIFRSGTETTFALPVNIEAPVRENYTFAGWALTPDATSPEYVATLSDGQITSYSSDSITTQNRVVLYAVWTETPYCNVTYVQAQGVNGAVPVDTTRYHVGDLVTVDFSKLPVNPGYHFEGWQRDESTTYKMSETGQVTFEIKAADFLPDVTVNQITLTEQIAANKYRVTFYYKETPIDEKEFTYDGEIPIMTSIMTDLKSVVGDDEYKNYTFEGWSLVNGGSVSYTNEKLKNLSVVNNGKVSLYAVLKAKDITLEIDNQNGTETYTKQTTYGAVLPAITEIPSKEGFIFDGYYTSANPQASDIPVYDANLNATGKCTFNTDTTLYAKWTPRTYKIIYIYEGNTLYTDTLTYRENPDNRKTSVATSSIFPTGVIVPGATTLYGWSKNGQNEGDVYRVGAGYKYDLWEAGSGNDMILYPIIVPDEKVKVTYDANGGTGLPVDDTEYQSGDRVQVLFNKIPVRSDYVFLGWSIDPNLDGSTLAEGYVNNFYRYDKDGINDYSFTAQRNVTLYAVWKPGTYSITYESNVADAVKRNDVTNVITIEKGSNASRHAGEIYTRTGYVLEGWSTSRNLNNAVVYDLNSSIDTVLTSKDNITLYTVWSPAEVIVTFDTVGGNDVSEMKVSYDSVYGVLPAPEKEGYTFEGWYASYDAQTGEYAYPVSSTTKVQNAERHVLYAKWTENTFTIKYHKNYGTDEVISKDYNVNQETILMNEEEFARNGHNLLGFAVSANGPVVYQIGQSVGDGWASKGAVVHLYCVWDIETSVNVEPTQSYIYYVSNGATNGLAPVYSVYTTNTTATIQDNTGNMSKYGYYFDGWNTEPDGTGISYAPGDTLKLSRSVILFADWKVNRYKLLLEKDRGVEQISVSPQKEFYTYGEEIAVTAKIKDGYIWNGFVSGNEEDVPSSCGEERGDGTFVYNFKMSGAVASITATTKVALQMDANGGTYSDDTTLKSYEWNNDTVLDQSLVEMPSKGTGYNFIGWFTDKECNHPWNETDLITESMTLYAGWGYAAGTGEMSVLAIGNQTYTGAAITPEVVVMDGDRILKAGTDYTVTYKNNKSVNKGGEYVTTNALSLSESSINSQKVNTKLPYVTIKGKGNYTGTISMNFNIYPKDLSTVDTDKELNLYYEQYVAANSKKELNPPVVLTYTPQNGKQLTLKAGTDYTVTYSGAAGSNLKAIPKGATGTYVMKVTAKEGGSFTNSFTKEITIVNGTNDLANAKVSIKAATITKDLTADNLNMTVKLGKTTLLKGTDYNVEFVNGTPKTQGTYMVLIKAADGSNYTGAVTGKLVLKAATLNKVKVNILTNAVYSGENYQDGIVSLVDNGTVLTEGVDYTTTYKGGTNAGKVDVTIIGKGIYTGSSKKVSYKIEPYDLSIDLGKMVTVISPSKPAKYSNAGAVPEFKVLFGTTELRKGVDYKATYQNNTKLTSEYALTRPQIVIEGIGNFKGKISGGTFTIAQREFTQDSMSVSATGITYKENSILDINFKLFEAGGKKALTAGKDYDKNHITYTCNGETITKCPPIGSEITVTVNGTGNYKGTYSFTVPVGSNSIGKTKNQKIVKPYTGNEVTLTGEELGLTYTITNTAEAEYFNRIGTYVKVGTTNPCTTLKVKDTIVLEARRDYDLENAVYTNHVKKGKATVTINGKGAFIGSKKISYTIDGKSLKWWERIF